MSDINWSLYNIPSYDMTDLRKSRELAYNQQADTAEMLEKAIRERREQRESKARREKILQTFEDTHPAIGALLSTMI